MRRKEIKTEMKLPQKSAKSSKRGAHLSFSLPASRGERENFAPSAPFRG
jgi:hypothetical protein